jgi:hypothetical protein
MAIDTDRIDDCVLALLLLGRHDGQRVWKSFDWDAMDRLHKKGLISDTIGRGKSVIVNSNCAPLGPRKRNRPSRRMRLRCANSISNWAEDCRFSVGNHVEGHLLKQRPRDQRDLAQGAF